MSKKIAAVVGFAMALLLLAGCGTRVRILSLELRELKGRVSHLETQFGRHDESLRELQTQVEQNSVQPQTARVSSIKSFRPARSKVKLTTRELQLALRNAGHNPGPLDGKVGRRTVFATRAFQRHLGLMVTGNPRDTGTASALAEYR